MVEVYSYIQADEVENAVECGLKLSKWFQKEILIENDLKKCIAALLNPKDDMEKYKSGVLTCIKLELNPNYCYVADSYLYQVGLKNPNVMEMYLKSIIPVKDYIFGTYRLPECLVTSTVVGGQVAVLDKRKDSPLLFDNSEELYINNIIQSHTEENSNFNDCLLYHYYKKQALDGKMKVFEEKQKGIAVFVDVKENKAVTIKMPEDEC